MRHERTIPELFNDLVEHLSTLFRKEVQLAKAEAREKVQQATHALIYMAIGGVLALAALIVLLFALAAFLAAAGLNEGLAFLIVAVLAAAIGGGLLWKGMNDLKATNLKPKRTINQVSADVRTAKEQV
jgi:uncharacterized membrane-anchored protein